MIDEINVIVARYREELAWLAELDLPFLVYDKSGELPGAVHLPNIGRETHTYLTHIVNNYDRLAPYMVFLQGDPFVHLSADGQAGPKELRERILETVERGAHFQGFAWFKLKCDGLGRPHDLKKSENKGRWPGWGKDIPVADVFCELFDSPAPKQFIARASTGNFMVSAERIRTRPLSMYRHALRLVEDDPHDGNNTGHAFERLWQLIFNGNMSWNKDKY